MWLLVPLLACSAGDGPDTSLDTGHGGLDTACAQAYAVTWQNWADGFFTTYCRACHSGSTTDRQGAPEGLDFDTLAQVRDQADAIESAVLVGERMPVGGGVVPDDLVLLQDFLDCGLEN